MPDQDAVDSVVDATTTPRSTSASRTTASSLNVFVDRRGRGRAEGRRLHASAARSRTPRPADPHGSSARRRIDDEALAADIAENGLPKGAKFEGKSVVPTPGDTVIQRANTFTDVVGPSGGTTTARFLYVEAHNKSTKVTGTTTVTGPTLALSYAGADGVYSAADQHGPLHRHRPDARRLHVPPAADPPARPRDSADVKTIRIATAATAGGAAASIETYKVTEWLGKDLPPHVAGFKNQPFFTHYMDPTENRADLDALAAAYPNLMSVVNMPEKTSGYQRKSQAIMSGSNAIGAAPAAQLGTPVFNTTGEITAAAPVATHPVHARPRDRPLRDHVDGIPSGSTDFILALKDPDRRRS